MLKWELKEVALAWGLLNLVLFGVALVRPAGFRSAVEAFPRHYPSGIVLACAALTWSGWLIHQMPLGFLESYKPLLVVLTPMSMIFVVILMKELLAPRALGGLLLLVATPILEGIRWHESGLRYVVAGLTYVVIVWAMMLVLSPFRFRQLLAPLIRENRIKLFALAGLVIGFVLLGIGLAV